MTFEQLRVFLVVAESGNFTRAAEKLFISQPGVSHQILSLEKHLGQRLFDRKGRTLVLTLAGIRFEEYARNVVLETEAVLADLRALDEPLQGTIAIGAIHSVGLYDLPALIGRFHGEFPNAVPKLAVANTEQIIDALLHGALDLALVDGELSPSHARAFRQDAYDNEELTLVVPPDHPWAGRQDVSLEELYHEPLILRTQRSRTRTVLETELAKNGIEPIKLNVTLELDSNESIKQAVSVGLGIGFIPACMVRREVRMGILAKAAIAGRSLHRQIWLLSPTRKGLPGRVQLFRDFLLRSAPHADGE